MTTTTPVLPESERFHALDAARGFALLLGIVLHATMSFFLPIPAQDSSPSTTLAFGFYVIHSFRMSLFFLLAVLLFPTTLDDYAGYEDYFYSRRKWFFGAFALVFAVDLLDTALKGEAYFGSFGYEYPIRNAVFIVLCLTAAWTASRRFHATFVTLGILYQLSWIFRAFDVLE